MEDLTQNAQSPSIKKGEPGIGDKQKTMDFPEAIKMIILGKRIHKLEWLDKEYYGFLNGDKLSLHKPDGKNYLWIISDGDLGGEDYIVI